LGGRAVRARCLARPSGQGDGEPPDSVFVRVCPPSVPKKRTSAHLLARFSVEFSLCGGEGAHRVESEGGRAQQRRENACWPPRSIVSASARGEEKKHAHFGCATTPPRHTHPRYSAVSTTKEAIFLVSAGGVAAPPCEPMAAVVGQAGRGAVVVARAASRAAGGPSADSRWLCPGSGRTVLVPSRRGVETGETGSVGRALPRRRDMKGRKQKKCAAGVCCAMTGLSLPRHSSRPVFPRFLFPPSPPPSAPSPLNRASVAPARSAVKKGRTLATPHDEQLRTRAAALTGGAAGVAAVATALGAGDGPPACLGCALRWARARCRAR
jgi:hypothetical protein